MNDALPLEEMMGDGIDLNEVVEEERFMAEYDAITRARCGEGNAD
jgi:hypothetical protein